MKPLVFLPPGWALVVDEQSDGIWIKLIGPQKQGAAFQVDSHSVRGAILRQYMDDCAADRDSMNT